MVLSSMFGLQELSSTETNRCFAGLVPGGGVHNTILLVATAPPPNLWPNPKDLPIMCLHNIEHTCHLKFYFHMKKVGNENNLSL